MYVCRLVERMKTIRKYVWEEIPVRHGPEEGRKRWNLSMGTEHGFK